MRTTRLTAAIAFVAAAGGGLWFYDRAEANEAPAYRFATVERTDLESTVSATGALGAVRTVQVGTQVSGQLSAIHVDFNDRVRKGQLLARIDPVLQQQAVAEAEAQLDRAQAQLTLAKEEYDRSRLLFEAQIVTAAEFGATESSYAVARTSLRSAQINLDRARQNLSYTSIYAPIDGVIVSRDVDVGQTVAASLSAPQLFRIAQDLADMQILASVDEADIGKIREGQRVTFTVTAHQSETFEGTVEQVRLQSATTDNVVNYTAVVAVRNESGKLLPGMTATVKFLTAQAEDVLAVPNAALRWQPPAEELARVAEARQGAGDGAAPAARPPMDSAARAQRRAARGAGGVATLWTLRDGTLVPVRVRTGLSDGQRTQVQGTELEEGMQVITGTSTPAAAAGAASGAANPFQQQRQQAPGGPRPPGAF